MEFLHSLCRLCMYRCRNHTTQLLNQPARKREQYGMPRFRSTLLSPITLHMSTRSFNPTPCNESRFLVLHLSLSIQPRERKFNTNSSYTQNLAPCMGSRPMSTRSRAKADSNRMAIFEKHGSHVPAWEQARSGMFSSLVVGRLLNSCIIC